MKKRNTTKLLTGGLQKMLTDSRKKANDKYIKNHYTAFSFKIQNDKADKLKQAAVANGDSVRSILIKAVDDYLAAHDQGDSELEN